MKRLQIGWRNNSANIDLFPGAYKAISKPLHKFSSKEIVYPFEKRFIDLSLKMGEKLPLTDPVDRKSVV